MKRLQLLVVCDCPTVSCSDTLGYLKWFTLTWLISKGLCFVHRSFQVVGHQTPETVVLLAAILEGEGDFVGSTTPGKPSE